MQRIVQVLCEVLTGLYQLSDIDVFCKTLEETASVLQMRGGEIIGDTHIRYCFDFWLPALAPKTISYGTFQFQTIVCRPSVSVPAEYVCAYSLHTNVMTMSQRYK